MRRSLGLAFVLVALLTTGPLFAVPIAPGYDLLQTPPGGSFGSTDFGFGMGVQTYPLMGIPLLNPQLGNTDTIIQRLAPANPSPGATIPIQIVALQLQSVQPFQVANTGTVDVWWIVDVTPIPSSAPLPIPLMPQSLGQLNVLDIGGGLFQVNSFFDVFFDVQIQDHSNPLNATDLGIHHVQLSGTALYSVLPPPNYPTDPNFPANGFYLVSQQTMIGSPSGPFAGNQLQESSATAPEPGTLGMALAGLALAALRRRRS